MSMEIPAYWDVKRTLKEPFEIVPYLFLFFFSLFPFSFCLLFLFFVFFGFFCFVCELTFASVKEISKKKKKNNLNA